MKSTWNRYAEQW